MTNKEMLELGTKRSVIRELFEFGKQRSAEVGADKVFDFSLGNPNVPAPPAVKSAIQKLIDLRDSTSVHGYTSAQGDNSVRSAVADNIRTRFGTPVTENNIYMTCGAAASLTISIKALNEECDEFVICAPIFPEYQVFIRSGGGGIPVVVPFTPKDFQIDLEALDSAINCNTKAVVINSPNNPCGVIYTEDTIKKIADILTAKSQEFGKPIYIIADEPYRELVYDDTFVPYIPNYYNNTIVCYSYSKSLSLPGERIGYIALNQNMDNERDIYSAICGAGRALGYVCAPSMFQKVVEMCINEKPDLDAYKQNRDLLLGSLSEIGYECINPDGAFYLFVKSLETDANAFSEKAKQFGLLIVPGDDFMAKGYVRLAYCVSNDMIKRSIPAFSELYNFYKSAGN